MQPHVNALIHQHKKVVGMVVFSVFIQVMNDFTRHEGSSQTPSRDDSVTPAQDLALSLSESHVSFIYKNDTMLHC